MKKVILKKDREKSIQVNRHPWIFSGAVALFPAGLLPGELAEIYSSDGSFLALGYFQQGNSLCGRILSFEKKEIKEVLKEKIERALDLRKMFFSEEVTNCFRWINAEEDQLPGLIVDLYDKVAVIQISTFGMERLKLEVVSILKELIPLESIYEKSTSSSRTQEGMAPFEGLIFGTLVEEVEVLENGMKLIVPIVQGQKTGLFLDQREMRSLVKQCSKGKYVLNTFSYTGGYSLAALEGGAFFVKSVDVCKNALDICKKNTSLYSCHEAVQEDCFTFLKKEDLSRYDFIILDPPAFAKKRQDIEPALLGYKELHRQVIQKCKKGTLLLTSSCSYFIGEDAFQHMIFQVGSEAKRQILIVQKHRLAFDHPVSLYHPEGTYLKSFFLYIE